MFKIRVDVYHHAGNGWGGNAQILEGLNAIKGETAAIAKDLSDMNVRLQAAIGALQAEVTDSTGKLASIRTYLQGVPALVAAAVAQALADANVADEEAATAVEEARQTASDAVDSTLAAIQANPGPGEEAELGGQPSTGDTSTTTSGDAGGLSADDTVAVGGDATTTVDPVAGEGVSQELDGGDAGADSDADPAPV